MQGLQPYAQLQALCTSQHTTAPHAKSRLGQLYTTHNFQRGLWPLWVFGCGASTPETTSSSHRLAASPGALLGCHSSQPVPKPVRAKTAEPAGLNTSSLVTQAEFERANE